MGDSRYDLFAVNDSHGDYLNVISITWGLARVENALCQLLAAMRSFGLLVRQGFGAVRQA